MSHDHSQCSERTKSPGANSATACPAWAVQRREWLQLIEAARSRITHCLMQLDDVQVWKKPFAGGNSIANQILHICGNLQQWIVHGVPGTECSRDRDAEFSAVGGWSRGDLLQQLADTLQRVQSVLLDLREDELAATRTVQGFTVTVSGALTHSIPHLVGHAHQIMLLTRWQLGSDYKFHWSPDAERGVVPL
jgi:uncharacterized damage-inducible protein DinB